MTRPTPPGEPNRSAPEQRHGSQAPDHRDRAVHGASNRSTPGKRRGSNTPAHRDRAVDGTSNRSAPGKRRGSNTPAHRDRALPEETGSHRDRIAVAMSGGVDSSTAAALLVEAGHDVVGITLQLWDYTGINLAAGKGRCCSPVDVADARTVAAHLGIPHYVFDHTRQFRQQIIEPFLDEYTRGRTPSPCISCNRHVKFDYLWRIAAALGASSLATGHYAQIEPVPSDSRTPREGHSAARPQVRQGQDIDKDQSYFLFDVPAALLARASFPLGRLDKFEVRQEAARLGLPVADKPESYELCFIPDGDKDAFVAGERPESALEPVTVARQDGEPLGTTEGIHRFTVGQRRGIGVVANQRLYVLDVTGGDSNTVTVGAEEDLYANHLTAAGCNWLAIDAPVGPLRVQAQIRHRHTHADATIRPLANGDFAVEFDVAQRAIAPGQGVAFYSDGLLLGGGWIAAAASAAPTAGC